MGCLRKKVELIEQIETAAVQVAKMATAKTFETRTENMEDELFKFKEVT